MPRGGARIGAGDKPHARRLKIVTAQSRPSARPDRSLLESPATLLGEQQEVWRVYAPHAVDAGTLTPQTAGAFGLLCQIVVMERAVAAQIEQDGWTFIKVTVDGAGQEHHELKAHPLCSHHRGLIQRIEVQMKNFSVMPFGRPIVAHKPKGPVNPWSTVAGE